MYYVYMHEHRENGKKYIGITCQDPYKRWGNGKNYKKTSYFRNAVDKYGWDMFKHEILYTNLSKEEACIKEQELIKKYKTNDNKYGYNNSVGGEIGSKGCHWKKKNKKLKATKKTDKGKPRVIVCVETKIEYPSLREASRLTGISKTCISLNANKKSRQSYAGTLADGTKLHWQYKDTQ